ncbi:acyl-CoA dehydrogenase [Streptomyces pini]|uniref:Acyl-CoA dehydrogenase n=1 Tax=Streptomyces pini TaxID=1520580 RepID=A0A1I3XUL4_9ACTN|nr:acyl-CoA dehydrogenase [Streptomyces pini]
MRATCRSGAGRTRGSTRSRPRAFLFRQRPARGLGSVRFHDWRPAFDAYAHLPNVGRFREQVDALCEFVATAAPDQEQSRDLDLLLAVGRLFALVVHGQLILEQAGLTGLDEDVLDEMFAVLVRDFSAHAVELHGKDSATARQQDWALGAIRRPVADAARSARVWERGEALAGAYEMAP